MDPSMIISRFKNSFDSENYKLIPMHTYKNYTKNYTKNTEKHQDDNIVLYNDSKNIISDINLYNPFHNFEHNFINMDAIKLANIDGVFNFSNHISGYILKQEINNLKFASIDDGPGGFSEYILYRNPNAYGYGISDKSYSNKISKRYFDHRYKMNEYKNYINFVRRHNVPGVDLVVSNTQKKSDYPVIKIIITLSILKIGGTFVSKIKDIRSKKTIELLYVLSNCFENITLFNPISENIKSNTFYIICNNLNNNNTEWINILENINCKKGKIKIKPSKDFINWVNEYENMISMYKKYLSEIKLPTNTKFYDTYKCKAIWNLP